MKFILRIAYTVALALACTASTVFGQVVQNVPYPPSSPDQISATLKRNDAAITQDGDDNQGYIDQAYSGNGAVNTATVAQTGAQNEVGDGAGSGLFQVGAENSFDVVQDGDHNRLSGENPFQQDGQGNTAVVNQLGDQNRIYDLDQFGDANEAFIDQETANNGASGNFVDANEQRGDRNLIDVDQKTNDNRVGTLPDNSPFGVIQDGNDNSLVIEQRGGTGNAVGAFAGETAVSQLGDDNGANVLQDGTSNTVERILQDGSMNAVDIDQLSSSNMAQTTQIGTSNTATITQN